MTNTNNPRANAMADRLEQGARALASFASGLTDAQWQTRVPKDGRKVGVVVHHVASVYPIEIHLAQALAGGNAITGGPWAGTQERNPAQGRENEGVKKKGALVLLQPNSAPAA